MGLKSFGVFVVAVFRIDALSIIHRFNFFYTLSAYCEIKTLNKKPKQ